jgi:hypothetical protein
LIKKVEATPYDYHNPLSGTLHKFVLGVMTFNTQIGL